MTDKPFRDDCLKAGMAALAEFVQADHEALFDQAAAVVDALIDAAFLWTAERFDEECHRCEWRIRDHSVGGRCPTTMHMPREVALARGFEHHWIEHDEPDATGRWLRCWAELCERVAPYEIVSPGGVTVHEHYCLGHALQRGFVRESDRPLSMDRVPS